MSEADEAAAKAIKWADRAVELGSENPDLPIYTQADLDHVSQTALASVQRAKRERNAAQSELRSAMQVIAVAAEAAGGELRISESVLVDEPYELLRTEDFVNGQICLISRRKIASR